MPKKLSDIQSDFGGLITLQCGRLGKLGCDFDFLIYDSSGEQEKIRTVKIQCPGVSHRAVNCEIIPNGCIVTIQREATDTIMAITWTKKFQFSPSDGLFDFQQERMELEEGFLVIIFRKCTNGSRHVRFPEHYSMSASDFERCWTDVTCVDKHTLAECASGGRDASNVKTKMKPPLPALMLDEIADMSEKTIETVPGKVEQSAASPKAKSTSASTPRGASTQIQILTEKFNTIGSGSTSLPPIPISVSYPSGTTPR